ncbi:MAG: UTP--glucose-1-phosphate uridylyltransferase GalU [Prolixibacteraceae bacterium]|jgi:UTP--glucose-1-phosphate uridylyltransferase|nr:UTP--glucose-1-phosphate uridylyltransferase GalU [Prolixibacteraceae bacterium]MDI9563561.1 UTP--glucose-1-phosphate uridylyltransferase GalU [Bacteroidota bacterium]NLS99053.1 UTP--glucose-1-phosphate uridylyltransferase GalU [Bacteroidales bacterium]OQB80898.1 MAG: UTP--glucose-1-phosphate uridylyltransferase [Bacteroidetes bacterium ADurb.Bin123]HNU76756.1 UTP--glucose-1-phosphate uridylyltransferase GalU [Prolixibacteraceae bacterium]
MIKKAVIPAAGYGTRFLPITKSQPKEMIPIVDTPVIQYVVEEAVASGITDILMIIGKGKRAIEEHFDRSPILEETLLEKGNFDMLEKIRKISDLANIHFVWQKEMNGLGDAIRLARYHVNNEPFAILLGDTLVKSEGKPVTRQLIDVYEQYGSSVVALEKVKPEMIHRYGVIDGTPVDAQVLKATDWIEKPNPSEAPSNLAIASRYIFTPEIFDYLEHILPGKNNEIQLTDAMRLMVKKYPMYGLIFNGKRFDIGNKLGFLKTNILYGLQDEEIRDDLREWLIAFTAGLK